MGVVFMCSDCILRAGDGRPRADRRREGLHRQGLLICILLSASVCVRVRVLVFV